MKQKTFKEFTNNELYWFYVHFLNGCDYNSQEGFEIYQAAEKELETRDRDVKAAINYLKDVI